jgi:hypothetical protein
MKRLVVAGLVRLYPSRWRAEYGEEFGEVLMQRPLGWGAFVNVAANAAWQQLRLQEPWLLMGVPLLVLSTWYWLVAFGGMSPPDLHADAQTWWMAPAIFAAAGFWTRLRRGRGAGRAAIKVSALATLPFFVAGLVWVAGFGQWLFGLAPFSQEQPVPDALVMLLIAPILQIPFAGLIGWLGGQAGRLAQT